METSKVFSYLQKHAMSEPIPKADRTLLILEGDKTKIKGSKLEIWRIKGIEGGACTKCLVEVNRLTIDHIVPLCIISDFDGAFNIAVNDEENFQFLCEICNRIKSGHLDMRNPKTAPLLLKYIQPYLP